MSKETPCAKCKPSPGRVVLIDNSGRCSCGYHVGPAFPPTHPWIEAAFYFVAALFSLGVIPWLAGAFR